MGVLGVVCSWLFHDGPREWGPPAPLPPMGRGSSVDVGLGVRWRAAPLPPRMGVSPGVALCLRVVWVVWAFGGLV